MRNLWTDNAEEIIDAPVFSGRRTVDLCVMGAGFTGLSAALEAAGQGASVTVLEAETIGHGGSGRNVGLVNAGLWTPPDRIAARMPEPAAERLIAALGHAPDLVFDLIGKHGIACEPHRNGTLHLAHSARGFADLADRHAQQARRDAPVTLLTKAETRARSGSDGFHGALFDPRAGTIQPLAYARGLARAARDAGAALFERSAARAVTRVPGGWRIDTDSGGRIVARALLVATNAYHRALTGPGPAALTPVSFFQIATEPLGDAAAHVLPGGEGCWDTALIMTSLRRDRAGRVILGAMGSLDMAGRRVHRNWARRKLRALYPELGEAPFVAEWCGRIGMTGDKLPRILRLGPSGYAVYGYSGRGIAPGTLMGRDTARAALGGSEAHLPLAPVNSHSERMVALRGAWIETGATLVHAVSARLTRPTSRAPDR